MATLKALCVSGSLVACAKRVEAEDRRRLTIARLDECGTAGTSEDHTSEKPSLFRSALAL